MSGTSTTAPPSTPGLRRRRQRQQRQRSSTLLFLLVVLAIVAAAVVVPFRNNPTTNSAVTTNAFVPSVATTGGSSSGRTTRRSFSSSVRFFATSTTTDDDGDDSTKNRRTPSSSTATTTTEDRCDVAVFGGGFGGLYAALAMAANARRTGTKNKKKLDIVVVDPSDRFVFLPLLYDLTMGTASETEVCPLYEDLLKDVANVRHVRAEFEAFTSPTLQSARLKIPATKPIAEGGGSGAESSDSNSTKLSFRACVVAVGATPEATLATVPGASEHAQPFYTQRHAKQVRQLLDRLEERNGSRSPPPRVAVIGGGYGGVELSACVKRSLPPNAKVSLLTRGPPMKGTRAEPLVNRALQKLKIDVEVCSVNAIEPVREEDSSSQSTTTIPTTQLRVRRTAVVSGSSDGVVVDDEEPWDAVLWTAGSGPASPVCDDLKYLRQDPRSGNRLAVDSTLRCIRRLPDEMSSSTPGDATKRRKITVERKPPVWALGDCSEIIDLEDQPAVPKTAQAAMQQADVVAANVLAKLENRTSFKTFQFQDLGTFLSLGGPNAAAFAPQEDSPLGPLFTPLIDTARLGLGVADRVVTRLVQSPVAEKVGLTPVVENLGLSLGGHGLGLDENTAPGTIAGTLIGAGRRATYAARMPTNRQRVYSAASAALSTAASLAKEASNQIEKNKNNKKQGNS